MDKRKQCSQSAAALVSTSNGTLTDEELVVIATAVHMYQKDLHDDETRVLTIKHQPANWSNPILMMREWPQ